MAASTPVQDEHELAETGKGDGSSPALDSQLKAQMDDLQQHIQALEQKSQQSENTVEQLQEEVRRLKATATRERAVGIEPAVMLAELDDKEVYKATGFKSGNNI